MPIVLRVVILPLLILTSACFSRTPLSYVAEPEDLYSPAKRGNFISVLDLIRSRPNLSKLAETIRKPVGSSLSHWETQTGFFVLHEPPC